MADASPNPAPSPNPAIVWFRDDLRLHDNPALHAARLTGRPLLCVYIHDEGQGRRAPGAASRWWLGRSLAALASDIAARGGRLLLLRGEPGALVPALALAAKAHCVVWNRRYGAAQVTLDTAIKARLAESDIPARSFNGALLVEPWEVKTQAGSPLKVFTPFWRAARACGEPPAPLAAPERIAVAEPPPGTQSVRLEDLALAPTHPDWSGGLALAWQPGEAGARAALALFLEGGLKGYAENRDRPDQPSTSRLSPHLHFGEISPRQVWHAVQSAYLAGTTGAGDADRDKFFSELGWREFAHHLLFHNPDLATRNFNPRFDAFPWHEGDGGLRAWQRGRTGYPIVDAGMRQLWATGWMHNRVRMIVASFLVKHLLIDWRAGENWFWDTLVDADAANNAAGWQWVAGSGADASPYFRIFNPMTQAAKFDPDGAYIRQWVPELGGLAMPHLSQPWTAPPSLLDAAGVVLGKTYPFPIVDHERSRQRALAAFQSLSAAGPAGG